MQLHASVLTKERWRLFLSPFHRDLEQLIVRAGSNARAAMCG
jgi:hypothetical protein